MWFLLALVPPFLYSIGNILDKNLVHRYGYFAAPVIVVMSAIFGAAIVPLIGFFGDIQSVSHAQHLIMVASGMLTSISVYCYLKAIETNSIISVAPALQLAPIFSYLADVFIFSEQISQVRLFGCLLVIIGSMLLTIRIEKGRNKDIFNFSTFVLATASSLALAISAIIFKHFALAFDYWTVQFHEYIGVCLAGALAFLFFGSVREHIVRLLKTRRAQASFIRLNATTEGVMIVGDFVLNFAALILPLTLVFAFNGLQPLFLLVIGSFASYLFPQAHGDLAGHIRKTKVFFYIVLITIGVVLVASGI